MAEVYDDTGEGGEAPNVAVKAVVALLIALAVFVVGWWLFQGPSARLTPTPSARQAQHGEAPAVAPGSSEPQDGATGTNASDR